MKRSLGLHDLKTQKLDKCRRLRSQISCDCSCTPAWGGTGGPGMAKDMRSLWAGGRPGTSGTLDPAMPKPPRRAWALQGFTTTDMPPARQAEIRQLAACIGEPAHRRAAPSWERSPRFPPAKG